MKQGFYPLIFIIFICLVGTIFLYQYTISPTTKTTTSIEHVEWETVENEDFYVSVPYSSEWKIDGRTLDRYETVDSEENEKIIVFGKLISQGTYMMREYDLTRKEQYSLDYLQDILRGSCIEQTILETATYGKTTGLVNNICTAKGYAKEFIFNQGGFTYYLRRVAGIGKEMPVIDEEMVRIMESVR